MKVIGYYSTKNPCYQNNVNRADSRYTAFQSRGPGGLMLHSVGTPQPKAEVFARQWNQSGATVAVHGVVQADGTVYQCLPWNYRGWHAGGSANNTHIGVEMTEPKEIAYTAGAAFRVLDREKAVAQAKGTYQAAAELFALLCREYGLDPMGDGVILSHAEGYKRGIASGHSDPEHLWKGLGLGYTMDSFRALVKEKLEGQKQQEKKYTVGWHRDQKGWWYADTESSYFKSRWAELGGTEYYFKEDGYMAEKQWVNTDGSLCYVDENGRRVTDYLVGLDGEGRLRPIEPCYPTLSRLPEDFRRELEPLIAAGKLRGKSGQGENMVLDLPESAVRALIIMSR